MAPACSVLHMGWGQQLAAPCTRPPPCWGEGREAGLALWSISQARCLSVEVLCSGHRGIRHPALLCGCGNWCCLRDDRQRGDGVNVVPTEPGGTAGYCVPGCLGVPGIPALDAAWTLSSSPDATILAVWGRGGGMARARCPALWACGSQTIIPRPLPGTSFPQSHLSPRRPVCPP